MTKEEFISRWHEEKNLYTLWGGYVTDSINSALHAAGFSQDSFLKHPVTVRLKSDESLIDKAFDRPEKDYKNPYEEIEDKVGCRYVVLLVEHIDIISDIIKTMDSFVYDECRHFKKERKESPLLFTYQSVHYIVRPKKNIIVNNIDITTDIPCEVQIRTLLQHAYAELTHDAVYKSKTIVEPIVNRTVAKSMALIETTDGFFSDVNREINQNKVEEKKFINDLNYLFSKYINKTPLSPQKTSIIILDEFSEFVNKNTVDSIRDLLDKDEDYSEIINDESDSIFNQSIILFILYLIKKKKNILKENWPLNRSIINKFARLLGISIFD